MDWDPDNDEDGCRFPNCECNMNVPWPYCCDAWGEVMELQEEYEDDEDD